MVSVVIGYHLVSGEKTVAKKTDATVELEKPTPGLGRTVATAIHQAVTDPYFVPLEKLNWFLTKNPGTDEITLDLLTKWATDDQFPTCFVWSRDKVRGAWRIDQPESPWVIEIAQQMVIDGLRQANPHGRIQIGEFESDGKKYWIGYMRVPLTSSDPNQVAGVFFSIDDYLRKDVPRFLNHLTQRVRFPIVSFQADYAPTHGEEDGSISFLIRDSDKEIFYQQGRNFDPEKMIYAESLYYPKPIVCMQEGWDIEVFSTAKEAVTVEPEGMNQRVKRLIGLLILVTVIYWTGWFIRRNQWE